MTITLTDFEKTFIETQLAMPANQAYEVQRILGQENIMRSRNDWKDRIEAWVWDKSNQGMMGFRDFENASEATSSYTNKSTTALSLSQFLVLRASDLEQARSMQIPVDIGLQAQLSVQLNNFARQIEGMICCGDTSQYARADDPFAKSTGSTVYPGLLNGTDGTHLTLVKGGTGGDNGMKEYGDFIDTFSLAKATMAVEGIDTSRVHAIMDSATADALRKHRSTSGVQEIAVVQEMFPTWTLSEENHILEKGATSTNRLYFIAPYDNLGQPLIEYHVTKPMAVEPLYGGTLTPTGFQWVMYWKGAALAKNAHCVIKSESLNLAG